MQMHRVLLGLGLVALAAEASGLSDGPLTGVGKTQFDLGWTAGLSFSL